MSGPTMPSAFDWELLFRIPAATPVDDETFPGSRLFRRKLWYVADGVLALAPGGKLASFWWVDSIATAELVSRGSNDALDISNWPVGTFPLPPTGATIATDLTHRGVERRAKEVNGGDARESVAFNLKSGKELYSSITIFESIPFRRRIIYDYSFPVKSEYATPIRIVFGLR